MFWFYTKRVLAVVMALLIMVMLVPFMKIGFVIFTQTYQVAFIGALIIGAVIATAVTVVGLAHGIFRDPRPRPKFVNTLSAEQMQIRTNLSRS